VSVLDGSGHKWLYNHTVLPVARVWQGLVRTDADWSMQRKTAPFPLFRWTAAIGILVWTATGTTPHSISDWFTAHFPWLLVAGVLALAPEVVRIEFGGLKMELLRETREEVKALSSQVNQLLVQQASANANASVQQYFAGAATVAGVNADIKRGEETTAVPAKDIDWAAYVKAAQDRWRPPPPGGAPSTNTEPGSTVEG
jgi:hypothetical protein